ncbi:hypothetical protein DFR24_0656 [Panacagrimonas perspica]|uniref:histidine kinase n=1 Tax=Panacagrimonas perspica TaxID=381431 RepID=A0A4R7PC52_9GAMM|nr:GAF domain-containing sensor histidine kinase [Panacagrimonas perspica]TDU31292.1 hypothetical protein DFR24_0656 [Panacagrimonas perspica]THD02636.1 hypothetical protein B1810_13910 [Panacagrimonas perspica]
MSDVTLDIQAIRRICVVPTILELMITLTGMRFAAVARVTDTTWTACAVNDQLAFGLEPGQELPLHTTLCNEVRQQQQAIIFGHASQHPEFCQHATPRLYGFESYVSLPIVRADGSFFGTLCGLDPQPRPVEDPPTIRTLTLFAQLIAAHLDADDTIGRRTRELDAAREDALLRDRFVAVLGHDLRNPLNSIGISAEVLEASATDPKARTMISVIRRSCNRMASLVDDVIDFARGKLGTGIPLSMENTDLLAGLLRQVTTEIQLNHPTRPLDVSINLPGLVRCDAPRIAQLLGNLVSNAMTHGEPGSPVQVTARVADDMLALSVSNHGMPIPVELQRRIFEPFVRGDPQRNQSGLGLGLYIAAEIARSHGGKIELSSAEGRTQFRFSMPLVVG